MRNKNLLMTLVFFLGFTVLSVVGVQGTALYQAQRSTIGPFHIHYSRHSFAIGHPGSGIMTVTKVRPDKDILSGFLLFNGTVVSLHTFLSGNDLGLKKPVTLKAFNRLVVCLIGQPGAAVDIAFSSEPVPDPPPTVELGISPSAIKTGESATLTWRSTQALSCSIEPLIGSVEPSGSMAISPQTTTTYTISAAGPGGTATAQATLVVHPPPTATLFVTPTSIAPGESAILSWQTSLADTVTIEPDIGSVDPAGSLTVTPSQPTTYTLTATGLGGVASATATVTVTLDISLNLVSPQQGDTVAASTVMVRGSFSNPSGQETGISVNGIVALTSGDQFVANQVPLQHGQNEMTVRATDVSGRTAEAIITLTADTSIPRIHIDVTAQSGLAPFETDLSIAAPIDLQDSTVTVNGPIDATVSRISVDSYTLRMSEAGLYSVAVEAKDAQHNRFADTIVVQVLERAVLDALLQAKWNAMKQKLAQKDIQGAMIYYATETRDLHEEIFTALADTLPQVADEMRDIELVHSEDGFANYRIKRSEIHQGRTYEISYDIYFGCNEDGLWKIVRY